MLSATSTRTFGVSTLRSTIFLERRFRAHLIVRDRLRYDSTYSPPASKPSRFVHLYASLQGAFEADGQPAVTGPHAYVLAETEFDRVQPASTKFRSWGAPATIVELRLPEADIRRPIGLAHGPVALPARVWDAYAELETAPGEPALRQLMSRLGDAGVVSTDLGASVVEHEPERFERLWAVMRPLYEDLATSASLKQIAAITRLSLRQLGRDLGELTRTFGLFGAGFRDAMRVLRLRTAVLLLSSPGRAPWATAASTRWAARSATRSSPRRASCRTPCATEAERLVRAAGGRRTRSGARARSRARPRPRSHRAGFPRQPAAAARASPALDR